MSIIVRQATRRDLPRILELLEELTEENEPFSAAAEQALSEILAMPRHELLVAEVDGVIVGTLSLQVVPNLSHGARPWAVVENMVVDNRRRRQGIGRSLIGYALERSRQAGCYKVQLLSHKKRAGAHRFYRSMGFEESALGFRLYL